VHRFALHRIRETQAVGGLAEGVIRHLFASRIKVAGYGFAYLALRYLPQRPLTRTVATAILGCRFTGCMNSHSK